MTIDVASAIAELETLAGAPTTDSAPDADPSTVDYDRRDALAERLRSGDAPERVAPRLVVVRELAAHGAPFLAAQAYLARCAELSETDRSAIVAAVYHAQPSVGGDAHLPSIDVEDLFGGSPAVVAQIDAVAERACANRDLMALGALAAASAALARKVAIRMPDGFTTWPILHVVAEATSGAGKGPMTRAMGCLTTLARWERDVLVPRFATACRKAARERELLVAKRQAVAVEQKKKFVKMGRTAETDRLDAELEHLDAELARPIATPPYFVVNDTTPQRFVEMCHESGYVMLCHGEGKVLLSNFAKTDGCDGLGAQLAAWSVEAHQRDRINNADRPRPRDARLAAGMLLPLQPGVLAPSTPEAQAMLRDLADRGFFGRTIIARPRRAAVDMTADPVIDDRGLEIQARYDQLLLDLCESGVDLDIERPLAPANPAIVKFDADAGRDALAFRKRHSANGNEGGTMADSFLEAVASKLGEQAWRIAAVIAALRVGKFGREGFVVTMDDWKRAVRFTENYVLPHAMACAARVQGSVVDVDADELLNHIASRGPITKRALRARFKNWGLAAGNDRRERFDAALETLVRRSQVIIEKRPRDSIMIYAVSGAA